jgi:broad specificity phosphatase PhoE
MRLLLLRHAAHDLAGRALAGRMAGLGLNEAGRSQVQALVHGALRGERIDRVYSSPQLRALQTAEPIAQARGLPVQVLHAFDEVDFGAWTGLAFEEVRARDPELWQRWVDQRSVAAPPEGEAFTQVAQRVRDGVSRLQHEHPEGCVLVVSHGDVIKAALALCLGLSLDLLERFEVGCAGVSVMEVWEGGARVLGVNGNWPGSA